MKPKWKWLPPWNMPEDPVKAVSWFLHWLLQVLVRYFYILIVAGLVYETYMNGIIGLLGTLLIGLVVWGLLAGLLMIINFASSISQTLEEVNRLSQNPFGSFSSFGNIKPPFGNQEPEEKNVVEGSIITDLDEERRKRRQES